MEPSRRYVEDTWDTIEDIASRCHMTAEELAAKVQRLVEEYEDGQAS